jgi:hypothetical protein
VTEAVAIETAGSVYTSINGLRQSQHPPIWSLQHDASCIWNGQDPAALHVKQTAVYECKRLGDRKLATRRVAKALAEAPSWQVIETYWNTAMEQNNIWSIAFKARTKEILTDVC